MSAASSEARTASAGGCDVSGPEHAELVERAGHGAHRSGRDLGRRAKTTASRGHSWRYGIIPLRMEWVTLDVQGLHLVVADLDALRVAACIQLASHSQACPGRGGGDQFDYRFAAGQGLAASGLGDVAEQPVLDFVPFRRAGRVMAYLKPQAGFVSQVLQFDLEQAHA